MHDFPDIINSQIVSSEYDIFWSKADALSELSPRPVLVATSPFTPGSAEEEQLKKMLAACQLKESDYHLVPFDETTQIAWHWLRDEWHLKAVLLLGVGPTQLGVSAQLMPHQLSRFGNCTWIVTDSLTRLIQRPEIKTHLWNYGLKPAFVDKVYG